MNNKIKKISVLLLITLSLMGCTNSTAKKAIEESKLAIASGEYEKAFNLINLAKEEGKIDSETEKLYKILSAYNQANEAINNFQFDKAIELLNSLESFDIYNNLEKDIKTLLVFAEEKKGFIDEVDLKLKKVFELIEKHSLDEAEELINSIDTSENLPTGLLEEISKAKENIKYEKEKIQINSKKIKDDEKKKIITKGIDIIEKSGDSNIVFHEVVNKSDFQVNELNNKDLYLFFNSEEYSPNEYYYEPISNKMYRIEQGMWFIINDDYRNVTPKNSEMYFSAENFRNDLLGSKINFTPEEAQNIVSENEQKFGLEKSYVFEEIVHVVDGIKLYHVEGIFIEDKRGVFTYLVGSDGNLYNSLGLEENKLVELLEKK